MLLNELLASPGIWYANSRLAVVAGVIYCCWGGL